MKEREELRQALERLWELFVKELRLREFCEWMENKLNALLSR